MEAYKCDRCGNYYEVNNNNSFSYTIRKKNVSGPTTAIDLCDKCKKEFINWMGTDIDFPVVKDTFNKKKLLSDVIDVEKLIVTIWPENLNQRTRLRNALENKSLEAVIYSSIPPYSIGQKTWERVKDYILRITEVQEYIKKKEDTK